jgi:hypothetical protein
MRVAYQAADVSHPKGQIKLAASKGTSPDKPFYWNLQVGVS